jgi:hypothetical protein
MNQDIKGLYLSLLIIDYIYNSSNNNILVQDNNIPLIENNIKSIIDILKVFIPLSPSSLKKKRYLKGSKNYITNNTPFENRYITHS